MVYSGHIITPANQVSIDYFHPWENIIMKEIFFALSVMMIAGLTGCSDIGDKEPVNEFKYETDKFADLRILRYQVPGFEELNLDQKKLIYYLSQAALSGRDIIFDQYGKYNLAIRRTLENIVKTYNGSKESEEYKKFIIYTKRVWFSNGIYHHYSEDKFKPGFSEKYFRTLVENSNRKLFPVKEGQAINDLMDEMIPVIFNPEVYPKRMNQDTDTDIIKTSAVNFYEGVTQEEVEAYYSALKDKTDDTPLSYGLNSRVVKENGKVKEEVYRIDGLYGQAIERIVYWLEKAIPVAETEQQRKSLDKLVAYYKTGDLEIWDEYNILWVKDLESRIDGINGFIEIYADPLGMKATWEAMVNFKDIEATKRTEIISENAQWFENHSPVDDKFKKKEVKGVSAKVITAAQLGGDCYPATPIGINLPNADWIRKEYGSKSVTIDNITYSYYKASLGDGFYEEFLYDDAEVGLMHKYGYMTDNLHTDLHECLGHGSGQLLPGVSTDALKNYHSPLEEARADLFALYYLMDQKLVDLGLLPNKEAPKAAYIDYIQNGLMTQVKRIELGKDVEQAHMRCRQLISKWAYEHGKEKNTIEKIVKNGKTYFKINDFEALRHLFGELLKEVQRIKSQGDYEAGKLLVENYGVKIDYDLHKEVKERYAKLNLAPYSGFINPAYEAIEKNGEIVDVQISYPDNYTEQMLYYSDNYSFLPTYN